MSTPPRSLELRSDGLLTNRVFLDNPHVTTLLRLLNAGGEEARVVGGAVRNALIGLPPGDIDITTTAMPAAVIARAKAARLRVVPTGIAHGTVTVVVSGSPFEVTTLREDVETDGRHAVVEFGRDFVRDALRRDFTINALSVDAEGRVHDYADGLVDLAEGRVRFIGDASTRIREDYLRILRFFRFSAAYATGPLDPDGLAAVAAQAGGLAQLSRERIRAEMLKLLVAPRASAAIEAMGESSILPTVLGDRCWPERHARFVAIEAARGSSPDPVLALAALALRERQDAARLRDRLRLSNDERDRLINLAAYVSLREHDPDPPGSHDLAALLFTAGRRTAMDAVTLWHVDGTAAVNDNGWRTAAQQAAVMPIPSLPVSGADIMAKGIRSGPLVGQVLKRLQALWIRSGFPDQPATLHELLDRAIEDAGNRSD